MSFQAYLNNVKAKTGKTPDDFRKLIEEKGLAKHGEIVAWLKSEFDLGHGHANAVVHEVLNPGEGKPAGQKVDEHFSGKKAIWRETYEDLLAKVKEFGKDVDISPAKSYISLVKGEKKFGILQPSTPERFDIGIKLKGALPTDRLEAAGSWNAMVTHRVRVGDPNEVDAEVLHWLKQAYEAA